MERRRSSLLVITTSEEGVDNDFYNPNPNYLTIVALEDGLTASLSVNDVEYSIDGNDNWTTLTADTTSPAINTGQYISFRGNLTPTSEVGVGTFTISKSCNLTGNCNSLLFGDDAVTNLSLSGKNYAFYKLFGNCKTIKDISSNFLPATTLASYCYSNMFLWCWGIRNQLSLLLPAMVLAEGCYSHMFYYCLYFNTTINLPATNLASYCYYSMFEGCDYLKASPLSVLPATTLKSYCYYRMFEGCIALTTAPELPAVNLASYCYAEMFSGCWELKTAPTLPAITLLERCYYYMFDGCKKLTIASNLPAINLASYCYTGMYRNCTSLTTVPELAQTNFKYYSHSHMFSGCTSLINVPNKLPATSLNDYCCTGMFQDCTSLETAPELPNITLTNRCYSLMFKGCSALKYIKALFVLVPSDVYTPSWVENVSSTGTFVKNINATWDVRGTNGIPTGWAVVSYDPDAFTPKQCLSLSIEADDISGKVISTTIYYTAIVEGLDADGNTITKTITGTDTVEVGQNTSTTNSVPKTVSYTYMGVTATTTITQGPWVDASYTVNLNNQWQLSSTVSNPNSSLYEGVYQSYANKGTGNSGDSMYIDIDGYTNFKLYIRSYAESSYDYVMVSQLDKTLTYSSSYSDTTLVKAHTRGNQKSGTAINDYTLVEFTNIDGGSHRIQIIYRKDSSSHSGDDRGYVLIPKNQ